jgi:hypothetical protein
MALLFAKRICTLAAYLQSSNAGSKCGMLVRIGKNHKLVSFQQQYGRAHEAFTSFEDFCL